MKIKKKIPIYDLKQREENDIYISELIEPLS